MVAMTVLGEVCSFSRGLTYKKSDEVALSNNAILRANNITLEKGKINYDDIKYISDEIKIPDDKKVRKDSLLICTASGSKKHLGKVALIEQNINFAFGGFMGMLTPNERVDAKYLYWLTQTKQYFDFILGLSDGANINNLKFSQLKNFPVPLLPLNEQKRIVAILDEVFADIEQVRAKTEQNLKNARELFESYLQQVFSQRGEGWKETVLGTLGKVSMCKRILKKQTAVSGDIPFYKIGTFGRTANAFIGNDIYQEYKEKYSFPKKGDILISAAGTIGRRVIYDGQPAYFQDSNIVWIDNDEKMILNNYLYQFYGVCDWNPSKGATISRLYNDDLRKIKISFPSISEQKELVVRMVALSEKIKTTQINYQKKLEKLDELKKSILQKAFSGELTKTSDNKTKQGALA